MSGLAFDTLVVTTVLVVVAVTLGMLAAVTLGTLAARLFMAATRPAGTAGGSHKDEPAP